MDEVAAAPRASACSTWRQAPAWSPPSCSRAVRLRGRRRRPERGDARRARAPASPPSRPGASSSKAQAEELPFADASFDALTFTYLLRYVDDPARDDRELARVVRPGAGGLARVRRAAIGARARGLASVHVVGLPALGASSRASGARSGASSAPASAASTSATRSSAIVAYWREPGSARSGAEDELRGGVVMSRDASAGVSAGRAVRADALAPGASTRVGARRGRRGDLLTLLHPPYTLWHLSYFAIGAALAPTCTSTACCGGSRPSRSRSAWRRTRSTSSTTARCGPASATARSSRWRPRAAGALAIGVAGIVVVSAWLAPLVVLGGAVPARLQPRAGRRALPQRPLVRGRLGRLPRVHRLLRQRAAASTRRAADRRRLPGDEPRPAPPELARARAAPPHAHGRGRAHAAATAPPSS